MIAQKAVCDCGFVQLDHPAYSPELAPSDYFLFCNLKSHLRGVRYPDDEALKESVKKWLQHRQKISILVAFTVCHKNVANAPNSVVIILKNKLLFVTFSFFFMAELQNFLNAPRISLSLSISA